MKISYKKLWVLLAEKEMSKAEFRDALELSTGTMTKLNKACKEKVKPQIGLAARKFGRRGRKRSAAQISQHKVPA